MKRVLFSEKSKINISSQDEENASIKQVCARAPTIRNVESSLYLPVKGTSKQ